MSVRRPQPRRAAPADPADRKDRRWRRWVLAPVVLLLCAVVAWPRLDADRGTDAEPAAAPTPTVRTEPGAGTSASASTEQRPTDDTVEQPEKSAGAKETCDLPVDRTKVKGVSTEPGPYVKLGRIAIPRVGLDAALGEGVFAETLDRGPGHWPGTPMPGRAGNSVISGHRNTHTQPFHRIDELEPGDRIVVTPKRQEPTTYAVEDTTIVRESEYRKFVLRQPKSRKLRQLTIFTCHAEGDRIVVRAVTKAG